jgi:hypothetical protein
LHIENLALAPILTLSSEGSGVQEVVQNIPDFFKGQIKVRDDVENQILVVKGIYLHRLFYPGESFGVILTKTKKEFKKKEREEVTLQSRVASRNGLRSGVKAKRCPGLGVRAVRLES